MSTTLVSIDRSKGAGFTTLNIHVDGRDYTYTGKTAEAIISGMNEHAANHIIKMQQGLNDAHPHAANVVRDFVVNRAIQLRKGEL